MAKISLALQSCCSEINANVKQKDVAVKKMFSGCKNTGVALQNLKEFKQEFPLAFFFIKGQYFHF